MIDKARGKRYRLDRNPLGKESAMAARKKKSIPLPAESTTLTHAPSLVLNPEMPSETTNAIVEPVPLELSNQAPISDEQPVLLTAPPKSVDAPSSAVPVQEASSTAISKPPGRAWSERFIHPVKYSRSNFKDAAGKHFIAFRFDLPPGETKPSAELLAVLHNHQSFKQGKPNGLDPQAGEHPETVATGLHYQDFGPGLGKLWVMPNGELGRTVADSLDQALYGLVKKIERSTARGQ